MGTLRRRRVWLAVLLAILISGLGHAYLRRWGRAFGWYVGITATLVFIVPDAAIDQLLGGAGQPSLVDLVPALVVVAASVLDAYVLAVRNNREYERQQRERVGPGASEDADAGVGSGSAVDGPRIGGSSPEKTEVDGSAGGSHKPIGGADTETPADDDPPAVTCPHCGRETDPDLDFCHWCTEPLTDRTDRR